MSVAMALRRVVLRGFRWVYGGGRRVRRRLTPAGQVLLGTTLTAGALGIDTRQSLAHEVFALGAALMVTAFLLQSFQRQRFSITRRLPPLATMGQPFGYRIAIRADGGRLEGGLGVLDELETVFPSVTEFRHRGLLYDARRNWFDRKVGYPRFVGLVRHATGAAIPEVTLGDQVHPGGGEVRLQATPLRRGFIHFRCTVVARPEPLGLVRSLHRTPSPGRLLVLPRRYAVPRLGLPGTRREQPGGVAFSGHVGESEEFVATRDYRPGDPVRRIHWRGWARVGHPVVREYQDEFFVRHALVLDTFTTTATPAFEEGVSLAASFVIDLPGTDSLLDLVFVGAGLHRLTSGRGTGGERRLLEALACLEPAGTAGFETLANSLVAQAGRVTGVVLVLVTWDGQRRELVNRLLALGTRVVVFVVSPGEDIDAGPAAAAQQFWHLRPGHIQDDLDRGPLAAEPRP